MFLRNPITLYPTLDGCMIAMAQLTSYRANAAPRFNDVCISHDAYVRTERTQVNVENARERRDYAFMNNNPTIGTQLISLRQRADRSLDDVAARAGYKGRSSVQRYFDRDYDPEFLPRAVAEKLAKAFEGSSVSPGDIMALAGLPDSNATVVNYEGASSVSLPRDVPILGTALGAPRDFDGVAVEQTMLNTGEIIGYLPRPTVLNGHSHVYGLYVQGSSMAPRYEEGENVFVSKGSRPPGVGDDVVVYLRDEENDDGERASAVLIKRLVRRTAHYTELEQFNPDLTFRIEAERILRIDRVIPWPELLS